MYPSCFVSTSRQRSGGKKPIHFFSMSPLVRTSQRENGPSLRSPHWARWLVGYGMGSYTSFCLMLWDSCGDFLACIYTWGPETVYLCWILKGKGSSHLLETYHILLIHCGGGSVNNHSLITVYSKAGEVGVICISIVLEAPWAGSSHSPKATGLLKGFASWTLTFLMVKLTMFPSSTMNGNGNTHSHIFPFMGDPGGNAKHQRIKGKCRGTHQWHVREPA